MKDDWSLEGKIGLQEGCKVDKNGNIQVYDKTYIEILRQKLIENLEFIFINHIFKNENWHLREVDKSFLKGMFGTMIKQINVKFNRIDLNLEVGTRDYFKELEKRFGVKE